MKKTEFLGCEFAIDWQYFRNIWKNGGTIYDYYDIVKSYRTIDNPSYKQAKIELLNALIGCY